VSDDVLLTVMKMSQSIVLFQAARPIDTYTNTSTRASTTHTIQTVTHKKTI